MRFGVKQLLFGFLVFGVALGTVETQWVWLSALFDFLVWAALAAALTAALVSAPPLRSFARGAAVWGTLYFWMAFTDPGQELPGPHQHVNALAEMMHLTLAPRYAERKAEPGETVTVAGSNMYRIGPTRVWSAFGDEWKVNRRTVHGLAVLTFALVGGWLGAYLGRRGEAS